MSSLENVAYRYRGVLMAPIYIILLTVFVGETERELLIWPIGMALFSVGVSIRIWAQTHLHYRLRDHKVLTTSGPYCWVRNPIYIANTLMLLGLTVLSELLWLLPVMLVWCVLVYSLVVRREERHLTEKYGESYVQFMNTVPRWFPLRVPVAGLRTLNKRFLVASLFAETHCLLLLLPFIAKELLFDAGY